MHRFPELHVTTVLHPQPCSYFVQNFLQFSGLFSYKKSSFRPRDRCKLFYAMTTSVLYEMMHCYSVVIHFKASPSPCFIVSQYMSQSLETFQY